VKYPYEDEKENYSDIAISNVLSIGIGRVLISPADSFRYKVTEKDMLKEATRQAVRKLLTLEGEEGMAFRSALSSK
jgi:hypothetical protein